MQPNCNVLECHRRWISTGARYSCNASRITSRTLLRLSRLGCMMSHPHPRSDMHPRKQSTRSADCSGTPRDWQPSTCTLTLVYSKISFGHSGRRRGGESVFALRASKMSFQHQLNAVPGPAKRHMIVAKAVPGPTWCQRGTQDAVPVPTWRHQARKTPFQGQLSAIRPPKTPFQGQLGAIRPSKPWTQPK